MINQYTHFTFIDLNIYPSPVDELGKVIRSRRHRVLEVVKVEPPDEERTIIYCILLKSSIADSNSAVVYFISVRPGESRQNQLIELFSRNQIRVVDSVPDQPQSKKIRDTERLIRKADTVVDKNPQYEYLERKIKETA
ncbi:MAG: hypothetical protein HPY50_09235 [Firmicutes bacterium]|nr:hypothetical protein [Bacillota bacterium]